MSRRTQKSVRASCDRLWSQLVRARAEFCCERCGPEVNVSVLHAHHVYSRRDYRLRFEPRNGTCLCYRCHRWAEGFPFAFTDWFREHRADDVEFLAERHRAGPLRRTMADYLRLEGELSGRLAGLLEHLEAA